MGIAIDEFDIIGKTFHAYGPIKKGRIMSMTIDGTGWEGFDLIGKTFHVRTDDTHFSKGVDEDGRHIICQTIRAFKWGMVIHDPLQVTCPHCMNELRLMAKLSLETPMEIVSDKLKEDGLISMEK